MTQTIDFNYFQIVRMNIGYTPTLMKDFSIKNNGCDFLNLTKPAKNENQTAYLKLESNILNPDLDTDFFDLDKTAVFSKKIYDVLIGHMPIKGVQLIPAEIKINDEDILKDYWIVNIYNELYSFDQDKSDFDDIDDFGVWEDVEKVVLDKDKLIKIPLEDRLIYEAKEFSSFRLYHESIVEIIKSVNPTGFVFVPIEEWYPEIIYKYANL